MARFHSEKFMCMPSAASYGGSKMFEFQPVIEDTYVVLTWRESMSVNVLNQWFHIAGSIWPGLNPSLRPRPTSRHISDLCMHLSLHLIDCLCFFLLWATPHRHCTCNDICVLRNAEQTNGNKWSIIQEVRPSFSALSWIHDSDANLPVRCHLFPCLIEIINFFPKRPSAIYAWIKCLQLKNQFWLEFSASLQSDHAQVKALREIKWCSELWNCGRDSQMMH